MNGVPVVLLVLLAVAGAGLAAVLAAGEVAVLRVTRAALAEASANGADRGAARAGRLRRVQDLAADPARTAASASFVRAVAEVVAVVSLALVVAAWTDVWWQVLGVTLGVCLLAALVVVRLSPRALGRREPLRVLLALSGLLRAVVATAGWVTRVAGPQDLGPREQELRDLVDRAGESATIEAEDQALIRSVFQLGETLTREVMVPRTDMITVPRDTPAGKALSLFLRSGFSRIPVTGASADDVVGVAYFKDVVRALHADPGATGREIVRSVRPAVFVPESKPVDDLLREMQAAVSHIAIVVDEYGGVAGLVTIEDALEEIVGELVDEHDLPVPAVEDLGDGTYRVPARLALDELGELVGHEVDDDDVDTAGGLLAKALGKVPLPGAVADLHGVHLVADRVEGRRKQLATLLVSRTPDPGDDAAPAAGPAREAAPEHEHIPDGAPPATSTKEPS